MKKKQSPAVLLSVIVILVAIVGGWNLIQSGVLKPSAQGPNLGESRPKDETNSVASDVASKVAEKKDGAKKGGPPKLKEIMGGSLLVPMQQSNTKPKPNESSTSTQWYDQDSNAGHAKG